MRIITYILLIFSPLFSFSQDQKLMATCEFVNGEVKIRWVPTDFETWQRGIDEGYTLERFTEIENGNQLTIDEILASRIVLLDQVKPNASELSTAAINSQFADVIYQAIYYTEQDEDMIPDNLDEANFGQAFHAQETNESRHIFSLFAAEQDFEAAKLAAWGHAEPLNSPNNTYFYRVSLGDDIKAICIINTSQETQFPQVTELSATGEDLKVTLNWRFDDLDNRYSAFDIERSSNGSPFEAINNEPFVFMNTTGEDIDFVMYIDELEENGIDYDYRIKGITPFGTRGTPSEIVTAAGMPDRIIGFSFAIIDAEIIDDNVNIAWSPLAPDILNQIVEWKVLRANSAQGDYQTLSTSSSEITTFQDTNPIEQGYYIVELTDQNGHGYQTPSRFVQLEDNTPPAVPIGLTAEFVTGKDIRITWDENNEDDLAGYYIYTSNGMNAYFATINTDLIAPGSVEYIYQIEGNLIVDNIYFTIAAQDFRGNLSEESEPIELERPDITAPASPDIYNIKAFTEGIGIGWKFSDSDDVVRHELQRKISYGPGWEIILEIPVEEQGNYLEDLTPESLTSINYIDESDFENQPYDYRILAFDEAENISNSQIVSALPKTTKIVGEISNFRKTNLEAFTPPTTVQPEAWDAIERLILEYENGNQGGKDAIMSDLNLLVIYSVISTAEKDDIIDTDIPPEDVLAFLIDRQDSFWAQFILHELTLAWDYENMDALSAIKIYRSKDGGDLIDYDMIGITDITDFIYVDRDINVGSDYLYQITMLHEAGVTSEKSEVLFIRIE